MAVVGDVSAPPVGGAQLLNSDDCSHYKKTWSPTFESEPCW